MSPNRLPPEPDPTPSALIQGLRRRAFGAEAADALTAACLDAPARHGNFAEWSAVLAALPTADTGWRIDGGRLVAGDLVADPQALEETLKGLIPWRKGPLTLGGVAIDTEWRSDWKWDRVAPHIDLAGRRILDIGAGNGYFGWRMLAAGAASVIACDPTVVFWMQHRAIVHFAGDAPLDLLPVKFEDLPAQSSFDTAFSMGVLYHRRDPLEHLQRIARQLAPGGRIVLETLVLPGDGDEEFDPPDRYANMRNVHRLPTVPRLLDWLQQTGYADAVCVDVTATSVEEQRPTDWMPFHSLGHALTEDGSATIEGHPPPLRATLIARRR